MQAAVVNVPGQAPKYQSFADPDPADGEELVQVRAVGLHPVVKMIAGGTHYSSKASGPAIPGIDGVGSPRRRQPRLFRFRTQALGNDGRAGGCAPSQIHFRPRRPRRRHRRRHRQSRHVGVGRA